MLAFLSCPGYIADLATEPLLKSGFTLVATPGTAKRMRGFGRKVIPLTDLYPMPKGTDPEFFKSVHPAFYTDLLDGRSVAIPERGTKEKFGAVITQFKPLSKERVASTRPDSGGPLTAEVAAIGPFVPHPGGGLQQRRQFGQVDRVHVVKVAR